MPDQFLWGFPALALLALLSNRLLSRYLYMAAGVTRDDVQTYLWQSGRRRSRGRELMRWLEYRSGYAREFQTMARFHNACNLPVLLYTLAWVVLTALGQTRYIWAAGGAMAVLWGILTLLGVWYGKGIEAQTTDFFQSARYHPYRREAEPEEIHTQEELYDSAPPRGPFDPGDGEEVERRRFRQRYARKLFAVIAILCFLAFPIFIQSIRTSTPEQPTALPDLPTASPDLSTPAPTGIEEVYTLLEQSGFRPENAVGQLSETYPGITLSDGIWVEEEGLHLEYLVLTDQSQTAGLAQGLRDQLYALVSAQNPQITEESGEGHTLYALETAGDYAVVVEDGDTILYAYCPDYDTTWMKWFLNELGYLSTF